MVCLTVFRANVYNPVELVEEKAHGPTGQFA
jgi:hypothetical protein